MVGEIVHGLLSVSGIGPVCTKNLNPDVMVMEPT